MDAAATVVVAPGVRLRPTVFQVILLRLTSGWERKTVTLPTRKRLTESIR